MRAKEGISINSGLLVLGNVINALSNSKKEKRPCSLSQLKN